MSHHDHHHDHDHHHHDEPTEAFPGEHIELVSVGIDVGSATSQLLLSRIYLDRAGLNLSSRYEVTRREILHAEPQIFTPYQPDGLIDAGGVTSFVLRGFESAGIDPRSVDTGVVLFTGEAARRDNAKELGAALEAHVGAFVCAAAGHHMEGVLAAHGSGTVAIAEERAGHVLNLDIGGGTTKLTLAGPDGVVWSCAIACGGRLVAFDEADRITRLEPRGQLLADRAAVEWSLASLASASEVDTVGRYMARVIAAYLPGAGEVPDEFADLALTDFPGYTTAVDGIVISGGVATFVSSDESDWSQDLGYRFGRHLWNELSEGPLADRFECATGQATVLGASEYSAQVSGNTIHVGPTVSLPYRNLAIVRPTIDLSGAFTEQDIERAVESERENIELARAAGGVALFFAWRGSPEFARLSTFARGLARVAERHLSPGEVYTVVLDGDLARLTGNLLEAELGDRIGVVVLDGFDLRPFEYIDVGAVLQPSGVVPIAIKSVLFHQM